MYSHVIPDDFFYRPSFGQPDHTISEMTFLDRLHGVNMSHCKETFGISSGGNSPEDFIQKDGAIPEDLISSIASDPAYVTADSPLREKLDDLFSELQKQQSRCAAVEAKLNEIRQTYSEIVELANDLIYQADPDGHFKMVNKASTTVTGFTEDELVGRHYLDIVRPDYRQKVKDYYEKQSAQKKSQTYYEFPVITKTGQEIWVGQNVQVITKNDVICGFQAIARDITARRKAESEKEEISLKYKELFDNTDDFLYTHDLNGFYTSANQASKKLFGYDPTEVLTLNFRDLVHEDHLKLVEENFQRKIFKDETVTGPYEIKVKNRDGGYRWMEVLSRTILRESTPVGVQGSARDITSRKMAEEKLRKSEAMYRALFDCAHDSIFLMDTEVFLDCNEKTLKAFGCSREELIGKSPWNFSPEFQPDGSTSKEKAISKLRAAVEGRTQVFEWTHKTYRGELFETEVSLNRIQMAGNNLVMAIVRDLTNRRNSEKERESLRAQLTQAHKMEAIGTLAGGIAHDFNNLLQIILGYSDLLLRKKETRDQNYEAATAIRLASERGRDLVHRILTFSCNNEAKLEPLDINSQILRINDLLQRTIPKMIKIHLDLDKDVPPVKADVTQIEQIILNLAVNAQHSMKSGGVLTIKTGCEFLDENCCKSLPDLRPGPYVVFSMSDTGRGIDSSIIDRIFEPFFTTKKQGEGTGLGLAMVFGIVKSYGGQIICSSKPDQGASFIIYLPACDDKVSIAENLKPVDFMNGSETILVVDDEELILSFVTELLGIVGYKVLASSSPIEALELYGLHKDEISLVILDLIMPRMSGKECLDNLIQMNPDVKVIMASGYSTENEDRNALLRMAKGFVRKPYNTEELLMEIRRALDY